MFFRVYLLSSSSSFLVLRLRAVSLRGLFSWLPFWQSPQSFCELAYLDSFYLLRVRRRLRKGDAVPFARPFSAFLPLIGGLGNFRVRFLNFNPSICTAGLVRPLINLRRRRGVDFFSATLPTALVSLTAGATRPPAPLTPFFTAFLNFLKSPIAMFLSLIPYISVGFYLVLITC